MTKRAKAIERVLIVRLGGIGDVIVASTLVARVRADLPGAHLTFVTGKAAAPIARLFDVDQVIVADESAILSGSAVARALALLSLWRQLVAARPDRVLMLHVDARYRVLVAPLLNTRVDMLTRANHGAMIPVPGRWLGDEYARLLDGNAHVGPIERRFDIADVRDRVPARADDPCTIVLVPGGGRNVLRDNSVRRWPVAHYVALSEMLLEAGYSIVLIGAAEDEWVLPAFDGTAVRSEIGKLNLVDTLALMRGVRLVISHDTGPMHLARLVRAPLVALFGPTSPEIILSTDSTVTVLWGGAHLACRPCYDGRVFAQCADNVCMSSIAPRRVFEAAMAELARAATAPPPR